MYSLDLVGFINHNANIESDNVILANNNTVAISTISTNREINIINLESGNVKCKLEVSPSSPDDLDIQYSKDGKTLLISSSSKSQYGIYRIDNTGCYFEANIVLDNKDSLAALSGDGSTLVITGIDKEMLYIYTRDNEWKSPYIIHVSDDKYIDREINSLVMNYDATRIALSINGAFCDSDNQGMIIIYDLYYHNNGINQIKSGNFINPTPKTDDLGLLGSIFGVSLAISDCGNRLAVTIGNFFIKDDIVDTDNCIYVFSFDGDWYFEKCIEDETVINPFIGSQMVFDKSGDLLFISDIQRDLKDENYLNLVRVYNRSETSWYEQDFIYQVKKEDPSLLRLSQCDENIAVVYNNDNKVADIYQINSGEKEHPVVMH